MRRVTLLLSGVPQYVTLPELSYCLDRLFNTDEIGTFKTRDLPNHHVSNKRQIALDFMSSFDAMAAQEKLEGYQYEMEDGRQYTLRAKISKAEEYMHSVSQSPEQLHNYSLYGMDWQTLALIPSLDREMYHRANARLDAQLDLLRKQQLVIEKEKEILKDKNRLKREYGSMVSSFCQYQVPSRPWMDHTYQYIEHTYDESDSSSKLSRSNSREHRSSSWHRRSRSREQVQHDSRRRSSKDRRYKLPQIEWHDEEPAKSTGHRSRSKDRTRSHEKRTQDQRSGSKEPRDHSPRYGSRRRSGSKERYSDHGSSRIQRKRRSDSRDSSKEERIRSKEHSNKSKKCSREGNHRELRSRSREQMARSRDERSRSRERRSRSYEHSHTHRRCCSKERAHRYRRSTSKERDYKTQRSRSKETSTRSIEHKRSSHEQRSTYRRSRSRDLTFHSNKRLSRYHRRSRSSERRPKPLAIMPRSPKQLKSPIRTIVSDDDDYTFVKDNTGMQSETEFIKIEKEDINTVRLDASEATVTKKNEYCNRLADKSTKPKSKIEKRMTKFNSKIKKADMLESKVKEFTKDVMVLVIILLEELMNKDNIEISASNKVLLIKKLQTLVEERVEPLARTKKSTDIEVLRRYKKLYPREVDLVMIKQILDKIPKIKAVETQSTVTDNSVSSEDWTPHIPQPVILKVEDIKEAKDSDNNVPPFENVIQVPCQSQKENIKEEIVIIDLDNAPSSPSIKKEKIEVEEKPITIDIDSAEKPLPKHPQFVVVIKSLIRKMKKVGLDQLLQNNNITIKNVHYALRHMLRQLLKGQGYLPRQEIISKFRDVYPLDQDEEFVKNVIKDIKDGKYPRCMDPVYVITEDDCPDDPEAVVLIEKQHDVVTVADSDDSDPDIPNAVNPSQAETSAFHDETKTCENNLNEANKDPRKQSKKKKKKEKKKKANIAQSMTQSAVVESTDSDDDSTTESDNKSAKDIHAVDAQNDRYNTHKDGAIQTSHFSTEDNRNNTQRIQEYDNQLQEKLNTKENREENDNNVTVTAITIITSLDDLLAKAPETEPIKDIKEELEYEENRPDDSSLDLVPDSGPVVTSITITTSDAELFSIGQEKQDDHKEVNEIKEEEDTYYDAEESLLNEIERDINNDKFSIQMDQGYDSFDNLQTVLPDQNYSVSNSGFTSDKPQESRIEDEDETIESIGRYVASMY